LQGIKDNTPLHIRAIGNKLGYFEIFKE